MACATFAIAGCGSDATKSAADNGKSVTWSETFDGTKTDFAVKSSPTHAVSMSQATTEMMLQLGLEDKWQALHLRGRNLSTSSSIL